MNQTATTTAGDAPVVSITRKGVDYEIRLYRESDRQDVAALKQLVWDRPTTPEDFERTYPVHPELGHVPVFVAACADGVVGMAPTRPFEVVIGGEAVPALLTVDTTVHPDHRRRGLFTAMLEAELAFYEARGIRLMFSHSNGNSRPGYRKHGWRYLGPAVRHYRIRDPGAFLAKKARPAVRRLAPLARPVLAAHQAVCDRLVGPRVGRDAAVTVRHVEGIAADELARLYHRSIPDRPHLPIDEDHFAWLFEEEPLRRDETYLAQRRRDGVPVAGLLAHTVEHPHATLTTVSAVSPVDGDREWRAALVTLLARLVADHPDTDVFRLDDPAVPAAVRRATGFVSDARPPLSLAITTGVQLGVRPLGNGPADADPDAPPVVDGVLVTDAQALWNAQ